MPIYLFKCYKCMKQENVYFGFNDKHEVTCECGNAMRSVPPIMMKAIAESVKVNILDKCL